jgi:7-cyano-7-deazaguanine synthase
MRSIVLLSGGLDSTVALYWAKQAGEIAAAITFNYNQRHWVEIAQAGHVAREAKVRHEIEQIGAGGIGLRGPTPTQTPIESFAQAVVPCRNLVFIAVAAAWAEKLLADTLVVGFSLADAESFADCREDFVSAAAKAVSLSLGQEMLIQAPLLERSKIDTLRLAREVGCWEALRHTWTCYTPERVSARAGHVRPCGACPACTTRAEAFNAFGELDPAAGREVRA